MACKTLTSLPLNSDCANNIGMIEKVYFWGSEATDEFVGNSTTWMVEALDAGTAPLEFGIPLNTGFYSESMESNRETGNQNYTFTLTLRRNRRTAEASRAITIMSEASRNLDFVIKDNNGYYIYVPNLYVSAIEGGSGESRTDGSSYQLTIMGEQGRLAYFISEADALEFISTGSFAPAS